MNNQPEVELYKELCNFLPITAIVKCQVKKCVQCMTNYISYTTNIFLEAC